MMKSYVGMLKRDKYLDEKAVNIYRISVSSCLLRSSKSFIPLMLAQDTLVHVRATASLYRATAHVYCAIDMYHGLPFPSQLTACVVLPLPVCSHPFFLRTKRGDAASLWNIIKLNSNKLF